MAAGGPSMPSRRWSASRTCEVVVYYLAWRRFSRQACTPERVVLALRMGYA